MAESDLFPRIPGHVMLEPIGWGGMGAVYKATEEATGRTVALKVMPATGKWKRFQREMEALARLHHPGVVTLYRHGQTADCYYYTMELVDGRPLAGILSERLEGGEPPSAQDVREMTSLVLETARTMVHAHEKGVYHRDLSPANILVLEDGRTKIIDFGLAEVLDLATVTVSRTVFGTPRYLSPEILLGGSEKRPATQDIYALAVILYEATTQSHPFPHKTAEELLVRIASSEPERPMHANPALPRDLEAVILKAVSKDPRERYEDMAAFSDDLESFLAGRRVSARRKFTTKRILWALRPRNLLMRTALFAVLFAVLLGGGIALYSRWSAPGPRSSFLAQARDSLKRRDAVSARRYLGLAEQLGPSPEMSRITKAIEILEKALRWEERYKELEKASYQDIPDLEKKLEELRKLRHEVFLRIEKLDEGAAELLSRG